MKAMYACFLTTLMLGLLGLALSGCTSTVVVKWKCPPLSDPPSLTVDALEKAGRQDPSSAAWVVDLDKHYRKCDTINKEATK